MSSLELLVRPFQARDVSPPKRLVGSPKAVDPVNVSLGAEGGITFKFHAFTVIEFKTEDSFTYQETARKTSIKRISNPDDDSQYVDVERVEEVSLRNKLNPDDRRIYQLNNK